MLKSKRVRATALVGCGVVASSIGITALSGGTATEAIGAAASISGTCTGAVQGVITSNVTDPGAPTGYWPVASITDGLNTPYDPATGTASGQHQEQGVKISMAANSATIHLLNAQVNGENLTTCQFTFLRPTSTGSTQAYYQVKLFNARVVSYSLAGTGSGGATTSFTFIAQKLQRWWLTTPYQETDFWAPPT
jgi:type VI secretion system Hcp family effector